MYKFVCDNGHHSWSAAENPIGDCPTCGVPTTLVKPVKKES